MENAEGAPLDFGFRFAFLCLLDCIIALLVLLISIHTVLQYSLLTYHSA